MEDEDGSSDSQCSGVLSMRDAEDEFLSDDEGMEVSGADASMEVSAADISNKSGDGTDVEDDARSGHEQHDGPEGKIHQF